MASALATSPSAPVWGVVQAVVTATAAALVIGVVYALAVRHIPFVNLLTLAGAPVFGAMVAMAAEHGFTAGRVRHREAGLAVVMVAVALGFYASWVVWVAAVIGSTEALSLAWQPIELLRTIEAINAAGPWKFQGWRATGAMLWMLWLVEAVLIFGAAYLSAEGDLRRLTTRPFCTQCAQWIGRAEGVANFGLGTDESSVVREHVRAREWEYFAELGASEDVDNGHRVLIAQCGCGRVQCATVERNVRAAGEVGDCTFLAKELVLEDDEPQRIHASARLARPAGSGRWPG
jgi:hypothetical protein